MEEIKQSQGQPAGEEKENEKGSGALTEEERRAAAFAAEQVKRLFAGDSSGHDWEHTKRVVRNALRIAQTESCDRFIVILAALLHDADDVKLFDTRDFQNARKILKQAGAEEPAVGRILEAVRTVSFKGTDTEVPRTIEGRIVQDADRLDALGAVGIARAFAYGGAHGRALYDPEILPQTGMDEAAYRAARGTTVNHFYEKLFHLKEMMNTDTARAIAGERDAYMRAFLEEFYAECGLTPASGPAVPPGQE